MRGRTRDTTVLGAFARVLRAKPPKVARFRPQNGNRVRFGRREAVRSNRLETRFLTVLLTSQCVLLRGFYHGGIRVQCTLESVGSNIRAQIQKALHALVLVELVETWFGGVTSALRPVESDLGFRPSPPSFRAHASDGLSEDSS